MPLKDYFERELREGFYLCLDPTGIEICYLSVSENRESFSAEAKDGFYPITNFKEASKNFVPWNGKESLARNIIFVNKKLEQLSQKS